MIQVQQHFTLICNFQYHIVTNTSKTLTDRTNH